MSLLVLKPRFFLLLLTFLSVLYNAFLYKNVAYSETVQVAILFFVAVWFLLERARCWIYVILLLSMLYFFTNDIYFLNIVVIIIMFSVSRRACFESCVKSFLLLSTLYVVLSCIVFYGRVGFFYDFLFFENYLIPSSYRLLGLDRSPAFLGVLSGLSFLLSFVWLRGKWFKSCACLFFGSVLILTASRAALLGVMYGVFVAYMPAFFCLLGFLFLFLVPLISVWFYVFSTSIPLKIFIEDISSNRIVNWANVLVDFFDKGWASILFGIGKPGVVSDPQFLTSYNGAYNYKYVTYVESSIFKILIYNGCLFFAFFVILVAALIMKQRDPAAKLLVGYIVFCSVYYDSIFSVQYAFLSYLFFAFLHMRGRVNESRDNRFYRDAGINAI